MLTLIIVSFGCNAEVYNSKRMVIVAGTIRQSQDEPSKWCWINDKYHTPTGVDPDLCHYVVKGKIVLNYGVKYSKVITFIVNADEAYTVNSDIRIGASVGLDVARLYLTSYGTKIYPNYDLGYSWGNIWIYAIMER